MFECAISEKIRYKILSRNKPRGREQSHVYLDSTLSVRMQLVFLHVSFEIKRKHSEAISFSLQYYSAPTDFFRLQAHQRCCDHRSRCKFPPIIRQGKERWNMYHWHHLCKCVSWIAQPSRPVGHAFVLPATADLDTGLKSPGLPLLESASH